jgi:hypothetical protein
VLQCDQVVVEAADDARFEAGSAAEPGREISHVGAEQIEGPVLVGEGGEFDPIVSGDAMAARDDEHDRIRRQRHEVDVLVAWHVQEVRRRKGDVDVAAQQRRCALVRFKFVDKHLDARVHVTQRTGRRDDERVDRALVRWT